MAAVSDQYELVLMLDPDAADERRDQIASDARNWIESAGTLRSDDRWGMRKLAYEIRQRTEADYRFFRFESGSALLDDLNHNLKIADGVLRFRIFKVDPKTPAVAPPPPAAMASGGRSRRGSSGPRGGGDGTEPSPPAPQTEEAAATPATPPAAEEQPSAEQSEEQASAEQSERQGDVPEVEGEAAAAEERGES